VWGVSGDSQKSHQKFRAKYDLPFNLLVDADHEVCKAYGVWVAKVNFGAKYMGIERSTFVVGTDGKLAKVMRKVSAKGHAAEVADFVESM
jgi:peroxiredoxin Q/BCP